MELRSFYRALVYQVLVLCGAQTNATFRVKLQKDVFSQEALHFLPEQPGNQPTNVTVGLTLRNLRQVTSNSAAILGWLDVVWTNPSLVWKPQDYGNITVIRSEAKDFWIPDISFYNALNVDQVFVLKEPRAKPLVKASGEISLAEPFNVEVFAASVNINGTESLNMNVQLGSWSYDGSKINLLSHDEVYTTPFDFHPEWEVVDTSTRRNRQFYLCCPEPFLDLDIKMTFRRKN